MKKILPLVSFSILALTIAFVGCEKKAETPAKEGVDAPSGVPKLAPVEQPKVKPSSASKPGAASQTGAVEKKAPGTTASTRDHADKDGVVRRGVKLSTTSTMSVSAVAKKAGELSGKIVKVSGVVSKVCAKKGCWFVIASDDKKEEIRITAKDYGFFVPSAAVGKKAVVEGTLEVKTMTEEEARHMAKDGGKDEAAVKAIKGEQKELRLVSQSLEMRS